MEFDDEIDEDDGESRTVTATNEATDEGVTEVRVKFDVAAEVRRVIGVYFRGESFERLVRAEIAKYVNIEVVNQFGIVAQDEIAKVVREAIAEGWEQIDHYGRGSGKRVKAKDLVVEYLTSRDRYSSSGQWLERRSGELFNELFRKEIDPLVAEAKKMFKDMLDSSIRDKLAGALREAMGLKG